MMGINNKQNNIASIFAFTSIIFCPPIIQH